MLSKEYLDTALTILRAAQTMTDQHVAGQLLFRRYWGAFQERRKRQRERAELYRLNDSGLMDIGMTRGEIEYVVSDRSFDREESSPPVR